MKSTEINTTRQSSYLCQKNPDISIKTEFRLCVHICVFLLLGAFEELCREWILNQVDAAKLGFIPRRVVAYWGRKSVDRSGLEIDVMAINKDDHQLLLGECKFTQEPINARIVRALVEDKSPKVDVDRTKAWQTRYVFFSRSGFTPMPKPRPKASVVSGWICRVLRVS